ncbi:ABC transporter permease [Corynebacterium guangdongense]|nr:ABC transporter permease [Corynebacterium guangdongense]
MILGRAWLILSPLLDGLMYGFIFGFILQTSRGIDNFIGYLMIGITFFGMMRGPLTSGIGLTKSFRGMLGAFDFPAAALVFSRAIRQAYDSLIPGAVAIIITLAAQWGEPIHGTIILVLPLFLLIQLFGTGLMFMSARITAQIPDMKTMINLATRAWFFISGVFFSVERFVDQPTLKFLMEENPAYRFLTAVRDAVMYGQAPTATDWLVLSAWGAGTLLLGFLFFWRGEGKYANVR